MHTSYVENSTYILSYSGKDGEEMDKLDHRRIINDSIVHIFT